ncbi:MAG TPA: hypothetical protein VH592_00120 [Gemmataceae bacterium]|jgi:hypothetical protein
MLRDESLFSPSSGEISYDLVMEDDNSFAEGTYRVGNDNWQVFIFRKDPIESPEFTSGRWPSGVTGIFVRVPVSARLNKQTIEKLLKDYLGVSQWREVRGPDSMQLR